MWTIWLWSRRSTKKLISKESITKGIFQVNFGVALLVLFFIVRSLSLEHSRRFFFNRKHEYNARPKMSWRRRGLKRINGQRSITMRCTFVHLRHSLTRFCLGAFFFLSSSVAHRCVRRRNTFLFLVVSWAAINIPVLWFDSRRKRRKKRKIKIKRLTRFNSDFFSAALTFHIACVCRLWSLSVNVKWAMTTSMMSKKTN